MPRLGPQPIVRWQPPMARHQRRRRRRWLAATAAGLALICLAAGVHYGLSPAPRLIWNPSASAPVGLWRVHPGAPVSAGDMVLATTPEAVRWLAAERRYLPGNVPLLKRVAAVRGDYICALDEAVHVNGRLAAYRRAADPQGRPLPWWRDCRPLRDGEYLLLMDAPDSFDGRYFGPVEAGAIIGRARPLWVR